MLSHVFANAKQFPRTFLKPISGKIPNSLKGSYYRNGPGLLSQGKNTLKHWFLGDGFILNLDFSDGACQSQARFVQTQSYQRRSQGTLFKPGFISTLINLKKKGKNTLNVANTSILALSQSDRLLALCEGFPIYKLNRSDLKTIGSDDFGWLKSGFSAHYKIDPSTGDIFNFGCNGTHVNIFRATKNLQKICETSLKLNNIQSIHDFCLAGDYIVLFEFPQKFSLLDFLRGKFIYSCYDFQKDIPTLAHVYTKDLKLVKTFDLPPFYAFHFTNGFSQDNKITLQYAKYNIQSAESLFKMVEEVPLWTVEGFLKRYQGHSTLQQLTIDLNSSKVSTRQAKINCQFPVCEDHEVGKNWRYTYGVGREGNDLTNQNTLFKYDRQTGKVTLKSEQNVFFNEPALIRKDNELFLLSISNRLHKKTYAEIFDQNLEKICQLEFPYHVPPGFHGKWYSKI